MSQMIVDSIPQLQAQIQQISLALQSSGTRALPTHVRQQTEMQHQQLQMQLAHAQTIAAALAAAQSSMGAAEMMMPMGMMPLMNQGFAGPQMQMTPSQQQSQQQQQQQQQLAQQQQNQQQQQQLPGGADSAYQRQPVNSRRRNVKRERPSDFLEVAGPDADRSRGIGNRQFVVGEELNHRCGMTTDAWHRPYYSISTTFGNGFCNSTANLIVSWTRNVDPLKMSLFIFFGCQCKSPCKKFRPECLLWSRPPCSQSTCSPSSRYVLLGTFDG
jgi:hypothetical protein